MIVHVQRKFCVHMQVHDVLPRMHGLGRCFLHQIVVTKKAMLFKCARFPISGKADELLVEKTCFSSVEDVKKCAGARLPPRAAEFIPTPHPLQWDKLANSDLLCFVVARN